MAIRGLEKDNAIYELSPGRRLMPLTPARCRVYAKLG
jgi:hypothetical protein